ncbi:MAG: SufD family Fe-S cluster assembly protein [Chlamydiales bacterium]|nr:SufD family Fe-S cluster assembly protein [Chlamydiales bacterium]
MIEDLSRLWEKTSKETSSLSAFQAMGWRRFEELGFPSKEREAYKYLPLSRFRNQKKILASSAHITQEQIASAISLDSKHSYIVFVNGFFRPDLSDISALPSQVQLLPLSSAIHSHGAFLNRRLNKTLLDERDSFAALNAALHTEGVFLYIPPKIQLSVPIQTIHVASHTQEGEWSYPRIHLFLGRQSQVSWIKTAYSVEGGSFGHTNAVIDLSLEEGARLKIVDRTAEDVSERFHFEALRATLKRDSYLQTVSLSCGGLCVRQDYRITLAEQGAEAQLLGLNTLKGNAHSHSHILMEHAASHTRSFQRFKSLVDEAAQTSFEGKIHVLPQVEKIEAYQLNQNLLLSDTGVVNSKPNLEIFADDVKASHGVTVAQLDPQLLFYLKTRGVSETEAKKLLILGFCKDILSEMLKV